MIYFLISMGIFLISGETNKTQTDMHWVDFNLGAQLTKPGPEHTSSHSSRELEKNLKCACTTLFLRA
jgi:hypothetical protein